MAHKAERKRLILRILRQGTLPTLNIRDQLEASEGGNLALSVLYDALDELKRSGLILFEWGEANEKRGGMRRRYYTLTDKGRQALPH